MSGYTDGSSKSPLPNYEIPCLRYANNFNEFYSRFECQNFTIELYDLRTNFNSNSEPFLSISVDEVRRNFSHFH